MRHSLWGVHPMSFADIAAYDWDHELSNRQSRYRKSFKEIQGNHK
jgi:hypothetical protein